jgi:hypothetical protein
MIGTYVAKSILDDRLIDIPISPLMWDLILGKVSFVSSVNHLLENELV